MLEIAAAGMRSQLTLSPKGSLMRTPSKNTEMPWGVPSSGEAAKPRMFRSGWNGFPWAALAPTLPASLSSSPARLAACRRRRSRLVRICTLAGRSRSRTPEPGSGVVPTMSTCGSSSTSAGLSARQALQATTSHAARHAAANALRMWAEWTRVTGDRCGSNQRIVTPHGSLPTATSAIFVPRSTSMTDTDPERPQAT